MSADLRELLERTAASPTTAVDPARIASRSRRRTRRRRGGVGLTGTALVTLLAVVAWPGSMLDDGPIIEDLAADEPEVPAPSEPAPGPDNGPAPELPAGWRLVTIGDATFGLPDDLDILELAPTDGPPCPDGIDGVRAYLASDGYPTGAAQDHDPGGVPPEHRTPAHCRDRLGHHTSLVAAPLGTVPVSVREQRYPDSQDPAPAPPGVVTTPGGLRGERTAVGDHLVTYALPQVDLWLEFHDPRQDLDLIERILSTIAPIRLAETAIYTGTWIRPDGEPAETEDSFEVISQPGPPHCQWQSAVLLTVSWPPGSSMGRVGDDGEVRRYVRDPDGVIDRAFARELETRTTLPDDATFTGYRTEALELWLGSDGGSDGVFIVGDRRVEWWPEGNPGCL